MTIIALPTSHTPHVAVTGLTVASSVSSGETHAPSGIGNNGWPGRGRPIDALLHIAEGIPTGERWTRGCHRRVHQTCQLLNCWKPPAQPIANIHILANKKSICPSIRGRTIRRLFPYKTGLMVKHGRPPQDQLKPGTCRRVALESLTPGWGDIIQRCSCNLTGRRRKSRAVCENRS